MEVEDSERKKGAGGDMRERERNRKEDSRESAGWRQLLMVGVVRGMIRGLIKGI